MITDRTHIKVCIYPALATPGKFIVSSAATGNTLSIHGRLSNDEPTQYFDSENAARNHWRFQRQESNIRQFVFIN